MDTAIYSSPKPRLVDIEESPASPDDGEAGVAAAGASEQAKSPNHRVDVEVEVIGHSPLEHSGQAIITSPAGDTKEDGEAARVAEEEAALASAQNGEGKLVDVTVSEDSTTPEVVGNTSSNASDTGDGSDPTAIKAPEALTSINTAQGTGSKPKKKKKGKKKGGQ